MNTLDSLRYGWDFMSKIIGADAGSQGALIDFQKNASQNNIIHAQNLHFQEINEAIDELSKSINEHAHKNLGVEQFKGYIAEEWHAGTFNIEAKRQGSTHQAWTLHENSFGSVDIDTNFGEQYSLKYSNTVQDAENMQAALNPQSREIKYHGQKRLIAAEQVEEAKILAHKRGLKNQFSRQDVANAHFETEKELVGTISDGEGVSSKELSVKEAKKIAKESQNGKFDPEKHGYKKEMMLDEVRIDYVNQALKAGLTAASITAITQLVPELYKAIDYLIKNGEMDSEELKKSGQKIFTTSGEAFLRGSIAYLVEMAIQNGMLGEGLKAVNATYIGVAVTLIFGTIKDSILLAAGKIDASEMGMHFVDTLVISSGYLVGAKIGGVIAQSLFPELPIIAYAFGSLIGCSVSLVYGIGKKKLISFCVDTGFTCFGLVEQNYEIPDAVLKKIGIDTIPIHRTEINRTAVNHVPLISKSDCIQVDQIEISLLRRGIIGVNKVGFISV